MAKKAKDSKLKPDIVVTQYWDDNERFADLFNAVFFDGRQIIKPGELAEVDSEASNVIEHRKYAESIKVARDIIKVQKQSSVDGLSVRLVMLGIEGQEHIHYAMPMRIMGYDYFAYKKQYDSNAKKYKTAEGIEADEYLSKMKKTDRFIPVITVVIYYNEKAWDGAKSLHEMLDIPPEMKPFVNDYKMRLVEAGRNSLTFHNINNKDLFSLLAILSAEEQPIKKRTRAINYAKEHNVDKSVAMTVASVTNTRIDYNVSDEEGGSHMWSVFEETRNEGILEGRAEGIVETGLACGLSEHDVLELLQSKLNMPVQKAQEYFELFAKQAVHGNGK